MKKGILALIAVWAALVGAFAAGAMDLPRRVEGTGLRVVEMGVYDGPYLEDNTGDPVAGVAALFIQNVSGRMIRRGTVVLKEGERELVFEVSGLPPGQTAFVAEAGRQPYEAGLVSRCRGWSLEEDWPEWLCYVSVEEEGMSGLRLTNRTDRVLTGVRALYRSVDPGSGIFLGGICFETEPISLLPGQSVLLTPYRYVSGYSRLITVLVTPEP